MIVSLQGLLQNDTDVWKETEQENNDLLKDFTTSNDNIDNEITGQWLLREPIHWRRGHFSARQHRDRR